MQTGRLYANLTNLELRSELDGAAFSFPKVVAGSDIEVQVRLSRNVEGSPQLVADAIHALKASLGRVDLRPETGGYKLRIGDASSDNVTTLLQFNATAQQIHDAIAALTATELATLKDCTVALDNGTYRIRFKDGGQMPGGITCPENMLWPVSFVEVNEVEIEDDQFIYELRLTQAPVAQAVSFASIVPAAPTIAEVRAGGSLDDTQWNEIQKLSIPPEYSGAFIIKRGYAATKPIGLPTSGAEIADALAAIADEGGSFEITEEQDAVLIEFKETMGGIDQDLLEVEVFDPPAGVPTFTLRTNTPGMFALMRRAPETTGELILEFDLELWLVDSEDDEIYRLVHFRAPITFIAPVSLDDQNVAADLVWNKPPAGTRYTPFSDDELLIGHRSYGAIRGDGVATAFVINHNLDTGYLRTSVRETASAGAELINGTDFTVAYDNANSATITFLGGPPAANAVLITIEGTQQPATYQAHTHPIGEITGLRPALDAIGEDIALINSRLGISTLSGPAVGTSIPGVTWTLPKYAELFGIRGATAFDAALGIAAIDLGKLPRHGGGLLAALHKTSSTSLTVPLPSAGAGYVGTLYENDSGDTVLLPAGLKHRTQNLLDGEYAACDGRLWYKVARPAEDEVFTGFTFTVNAGTDVLTVATGHGLANGSRVRVTTTTTLPGGLAVSTDYFVRDLSGDTCKLAATSGGSAIDITTTGSGTHSIGLAPKSSFYPADFDRELFFLACNDAELRLGFMLELLFGFEVALIPGSSDRPDYDSKAQWVLVIEHGAFSDESDPARTGLNLAAITWSTTPLLSQRLMLTRTPVSRAFGCRIKRSLGNEVTAQKIVFGAEAGGDSAPATANFALRARLTRFDTEDSISAPRGFIALRGLDVGDGVTSTDGLGKATIKPILA